MYHNIKTLLNNVYLTWLCLLTSENLYPRRKLNFENLLPWMTLWLNTYKIFIDISNESNDNENKYFKPRPLSHKAEVDEKNMNLVKKPNLKLVPSFLFLGLDGPNLFLRKLVLSFISREIWLLSQFWTLYFYEDPSCNSSIARSYLLC
jgi:hypothetical protein